MKKFHPIVLLVLISILSFSFYLKEYKVDEERFVSHQVDPSLEKLKLYWKDDKGMLFGSLGNLKKSLDSSGQILQFAMNGGMYNKDHTPQGLFIQNGKLIQEIESRNSGYGNFYMQPNGVFYITKEGKAFVIQTVDFKMDSNIKYATQSGPMLLINAQYHEKLMKGSENLHIRNGVGILPDGKVLFAISKERVNFYDLATFFKQRGCLNALYLDGFVSRAYLPSLNWLQLDGNFGVIIGEVK